MYSTRPGSAEVRHTPGSPGLGDEAKEAGGEASNADRKDTTSHAAQNQDSGDGNDDAAADTIGLKDFDIAQLDGWEGGGGRTRLPAAGTRVLMRWFLTHLHQPYPSIQDKHSLAQRTDLSVTQVRNWFTNVRKRHWGPIIKGREPRSKLDWVIHEYIAAHPDVAETAQTSLKCPPQT